VHILNQLAFRVNENILNKFPLRRKILRLGKKKIKPSYQLEKNFDRVKIFV